jgi:hypothetical protein
MVQEKFLARVLKIDLGSNSTHKPRGARCQWLRPIILATQEAEIRRIAVQSQTKQIVCESLSQKYPSQKGLVEWLKVKALSSSPVPHTKKKSRGKKRTVIEIDLVRP